MTDDLTRQARDEACVFCAIVEGRAPRVLRREWDDALALVPLNPVTPGHTLIIPKAHVANYVEDPNVTAAVMRHAAEYAPAGASNLITSMGRAATQSVWHLHVHVIPRVWGDGLALPWDPAHAALSAELAEAKAEIERLRAECYRAWDVAVEERLRRLEAQAGIESPPEPEPDPLAGRPPAPAVNAADVEITTAAELDALPAGTIVRDRFGGYLAQGRDAMGVAWFHYPDYDHAGSSAIVAGIGPVTVCFTPGLTVADEGRVEA